MQAMRFPEWYASQPRGTGQRLVRELNIGTTTIHRLNQGGLVTAYELASKISAATGGAVSIEELCVAPKKGKRRVK